MMKLTKTGIGLLTRQYRSVLKKCWAINVGVFALGAAMMPSVAEAGLICVDSSGNVWFSASTSCGSGSPTIATAGINTTVGTYSVAMGEGAKIPGQWSVAIGYDAITGSGGNGGGIAIGALSHATSQTAISIGHRATASGNQSVVVGAYTTASQAGAVALGTNSVTRAADTISVGHLPGDPNGEGGTYSDTYTRRIVNLAAGSANTDAVNVGQLNDAVKYFAAQAGNGTAADASGYSGIAIGGSSVASNNYTIAIGNTAQSTEITSTAIGYKATANGTSSIALGRETYVGAQSAIATGQNARATNNYSIAIGPNANATGTSSVALGRNSVASEASTISVGHKQGDAKGYEEGTYATDSFKKIVNMADGEDDHDAATVGQINDTLNNYYTKLRLGGKNEGKNAGNVPCHLEGLSTSERPVKIYATKMRSENILSSLFVPMRSLRPQGAQDDGHGFAFAVANDNADVLLTQAA